MFAYQIVPQRFTGGRILTVHIVQIVVSNHNYLTVGVITPP